MMDTDLVYLGYSTLIHALRYVHFDSNVIDNFQC